MKKLLIIITSLFIGLLAAAQSDLKSDTAPTAGLKLDFVRNADNSVSIIPEVSGYGSMTVFLNLTDLENTYSATNIVKTVRDGYEIYRMYPIDESRPIDFNYIFNWVPGKVGQQADPDFVYQLPFEKGKKTVAKEIPIYEDRFQQVRTAANFKKWQFALDKDDEILASRAGIVIETGNNYPDQPIEPQSGKIINGNYIKVEHSDGSIARYSGLAYDSILVSAGDQIEAGQVIGKAGSIYAGNYSVNFDVFHYIRNTDKDGPFSRVLALQDYIDPVFETDRGDTVLQNGETYARK